MYPTRLGIPRPSYFVGREVGSPLFNRAPPYRSTHVKGTTESQLSANEDHQPNPEGLVRPSYNAVSVKVGHRHPAHA
eukprot:1187589-Prorocentrum_minimum.AAC.1